jgi:hypothetical protein
LFVTSTSTLTGQPSAAPGPSFDGFAPLAGGFTGQSVSTGVNPSFASSEEPDVDPTDMVPNPGDDAEISTPPVNTTSTVAQTSSATDTATAQADVRAVARADRLVYLGLLAADWFRVARQNVTSQPSPVESPAGPPVIARQSVAAQWGPSGPEQDRRSSSVLHGGLGAAASVIALGAVAYRLRMPLKFWWHQRGRLTATGQAARVKALHGPHRASKVSRITTRVRDMRD